MFLFNTLSNSPELFFFLDDGECRWKSIDERYKCATLAKSPLYVCCVRVFIYTQRNTKACNMAGVALSVIIKYFFIKQEREKWKKKEVIVLRVACVTVIY